MGLDYKVERGYLKIINKDVSSPFECLVLSIQLSELVQHMPHKELAECLYPYFIEIHANKVFKE